jgi:hypothetical protein
MAVATNAITAKGTLARDRTIPDRLTPDWKHRGKDQHLVLSIAFFMFTPSRALF